MLLFIYSSTIFQKGYHTPLIFLATIIKKSIDHIYVALLFLDSLFSFTDRSRRPLPACSAPNSSPTAALRFCAVPSPSYIILPQLSVMGSLSYQANWLSSLVSIFFQTSNHATTFPGHPSLLPPLRPSFVFVYFVFALCSA